MSIILFICTVLIMNVSAAETQDIKGHSDTQELKAFNLFKLCKIWGFIKYRNADIGNSDIDWDNALKEPLTFINRSQFDVEVSKWLRHTIKPCAPLNSKKDSIRTYSTKADFHWLKSKTFFSSVLREHLSTCDCYFAEIERHPYVRNGKWNVTPEFLEAPFENVEVWNNEYFKILSLFRYWNIIEYYHPYKYLNSRNWDDVLKEFIPRFLETHDELGYKLMLLELFSRIEDSHGGLYNDKVIEDYFGRQQIPVELFLLNGEVIVKDIFPDFKDAIDLKIGDVVTHINGRTIQFLMEKNKKTIVASNRAAMNRELMQRLVRTQKDTVRVTILNEVNKIVKEIENPTVAYSVLSYIMKKVPSHRLLSEEVGYLYPGSLKSTEEVGLILDKFKNKKAIVLDYRCYPSIILQYLVPEFILPQPTNYYVATHFDWRNLGSFYYKNPVAIGKENLDYFKGKLVVLLNEFSTSQPEFETLAFRKGPNTMVIGSNTGGTIGNFTSIVLPGNITTSMSGAEVRDINKTQIQKIGIIPDIYVERTKEGIQQGKDEILEKALDWIQQN